jgi:hypothetical protein
VVPVVDDSEVVLVVVAVEKSVVVSVEVSVVG